MSILLRVPSRSLAAFIVAGMWAALTCASVSAATFSVSDASGLKSALNKVSPGDVIQLAPGTYRGSFVATRSGAKGRPVVLQGPSTAVLTNSGYGLWLKASYWKLTGFSIRGASKAIVLDAAQHNVLDHLSISSIDQEGIHFRTNSSHNVLQFSGIKDTGRSDPGYGEAIYVGSAQSNWPTYTHGDPDRSDANCVANNTIGPDIRAEGLDIKEGTTGGLFIGNVYDATGLSGEHDADSFADVKGNANVLYGNKVRNASGNRHLVDGFQVHRILSGQGNGNTFQSNQVDLNSTGYGFDVSTSTTGNQVCSSNQVTGAASGVSNVGTVRCTALPPQCSDVLNN